MRARSSNPHGGAGLRRGAGVLVHALNRESAAGLLLALGCVVFAAGLSVCAPVALKFLLDDLYAGGGSALLFAGLYAGCLGLSRIAGEGRGFFFARAEQDISRALSHRAARHVLALPMSFLQIRSSGSLVQTLENGLTGYRLLLQHAVFTLLPGLLEIAVMAAIVLVILDGAFLVVLALCAVLYAVIFTLGARRVLGASRDVASARIAVTGLLTDSLLNAETVKAFCGEAAMAGRLGRSLEGVRRAWYRFHEVRLRNGLLAALVFAGGLAAVLVLGVDRIGAGVMTPGDLVLALSYMLQIVRPMEMLGYAARDLGQGAAFIGRLNDVLSEPAEAAQVSRADGRKTCAGPMSIRFEGVSFTHPGAPEAACDAALDILPGMKVGLVGASGSGKSTLIRMLLRFVKPAHGRILIDGVALTEIPVQVIREQIAFIGQEPGLFNESVAFNVAFPATDVRQETLEHVLRRAGLGGFIDRAAGERGCSLSGGERQRVAIARALMRQPRLLLADEPTASLDPGSEGAILAELERVFDGTTMIVASHRLRSVMKADLIVVLSGGRIAEFGTHEALIKNSDIYRALWRAEEDLEKDIRRDVR